MAPLRWCCDNPTLAQRCRKGAIHPIIADLGGHHLERPALMTAHRPDVPGVDRHSHSLRRRRRPRRLRPRQGLRSSSAPTRVVRRPIVSCHGGSSPIGKNSDRNRRAPRYGKQAPIFANVRSYSGVQRSGMSSDAGVSVDPNDRDLGWLHLRSPSSGCSVGLCRWVEGRAIPKIVR